MARRGKGGVWRGLARRRGEAAFTLAEVIVAAGIIAVGFLGAFATGLQARRMVSMAEEESLVCSALEQRIDQLRMLDWAELTGGTGLTAKVWTTRPEPTAELSVIGEAIVISAWDVVGAKTLQGAWVGTAAPVVNFSAGAQDLNTASAVKVVTALTWQGRLGRPATRTMVTVISKGGISKSEAL